MFVFCLIISILTGLVTATLLYLAGSGLIVMMLGYSLAGACALVMAMTMVKLVYPKWRALS